jgi:hypothetical protein
MVQHWPISHRAGEGFWISLAIQSVAVLVLDQEAMTEYIDGKTSIDNEESKRL